MKFGQQGTGTQGVAPPSTPAPPGDPPGRGRTHGHSCLHPVGIGVRPVGTRMRAPARALPVPPTLQRDETRTSWAAGAAVGCRGLPGGAAGQRPGMRATEQCSSRAQPPAPAGKTSHTPPPRCPSPRVAAPQGLSCCVPSHAPALSPVALIPCVPCPQTGDTAGCLAGGSPKPAARRQLNFPNERLMRVMIQRPLLPPRRADPWGVGVGLSPSTEPVAVPLSPWLGAGGRSCYSRRHGSPARPREYPLSHTAPCHLPAGLYLPWSRGKGFRMKPRHQTAARHSVPRRGHVLRSILGASERSGSPTAPALPISLAPTGPFPECNQLHCTGGA